MDVVTALANAGVQATTIAAVTGLRSTRIRPSASIFAVYNEVLKKKLSVFLC